MNWMQLFVANLIEKVVTCSLYCKHRIDHRKCQGKVTMLGTNEIAYEMFIEWYWIKCAKTLNPFFFFFLATIKYPVNLKLRIFSMNLNELSNTKNKKTNKLSTV